MEETSTQVIRQKVPAKDVIFDCTEDESEALLASTMVVDCRNLIFGPCANYSYISKILIVMGTLGVQFNASFHLIAYSGIANEFDKWYMCSDDAYLWTKYVFMITAIVLYIPGAFLFSNCPKLTVWLIVAASIAGASIKYILPNDLVAFYIGQTLIACSAVYAYVATPAVGTLIFDEHENRIFLAYCYICPILPILLVNLFPDYCKGS